MHGFYNTWKNVCEDNGAYLIEYAVDFSLLYTVMSIDFHLMNRYANFMLNN